MKNITHNQHMILESCEKETKLYKTGSESDIEDYWSLTRNKMLHLEVIIKGSYNWSFTLTKKAEVYLKKTPIMPIKNIVGVVNVKKGDETNSLKLITDLMKTVPNSLFKEVKIKNPNEMQKLLDTTTKVIAKYDFKATLIIEGKPSLLPPIKEYISACLNCGVTRSLLPMNTYLYMDIGGGWTITKDGKHYFVEDVNKEIEKSKTLSEIEQEAKLEPNCDWRAVLNMPLRSSVFQRHGNNNWVLVEKGRGFA